MPWIGVDLDGTLARQIRWVTKYDIGPPVERMVLRVKQWRAQGMEVRIFTARIAGHGDDMLQAIERWCLEHLGEVLPITNAKDWDMVEYWDDLAVQVIPNQGLRADGRDD